MMYERSKGGGVLLYMKNIFLHGEKNDITVNNSTEALWCEVNIDGKKDKVVIGICYDSPTNNEDQSNMVYNDICTAAKSDLIVMGDFNRSGINWATKKSDWRGKSLFELSQDLFLTQHVKDNTRNDAVLDLIFSSEPGMIENLDVREKYGEGFEKYSDHRIITFDMILRTEMKTVHKCTYNYNNAEVI